MVFEKGYLYHIYNQGNNKQDIFRNRDNYLFFLKKINTYILPYSDLIAWCLMPNHFHLMLKVNEVELTSTHGVTLSHPVSNNPSHTTRINRSHPVDQRTMNDSIAILLRSYTRAINKQQKRSGSLFRGATKAECINCFKDRNPSFIQSNISTSNLLPEKQYPQVCYDYIHQNPIKAGIVKNAVDWEFSSAKDYAGLRNGKLINKQVAEKYIDFTTFR